MLFWIFDESFVSLFGVLQNFEFFRVLLSKHAIHVTVKSKKLSFDPKWNPQYREIWRFNELRLLGVVLSGGDVTMKNQGKHKKILRKSINFATAKNCEIFSKFFCVFPDFSSSHLRHSALAGSQKRWFSDRWRSNVSQNKIFAVNPCFRGDVRGISKPQ